MLIPSLTAAENIYKSQGCRFSINHLHLVHSTYRRSICNHISFSDYLAIYIQNVDNLVSILQPYVIEYILFADTPHHLEQVIFLSAASLMQVKCFGLSGTFTERTGFVFQISADCGVSRILKTSHLSIDWSSKNISEPISLDNQTSYSNLDSHYGRGELYQSHHSAREKVARLSNYIADGDESREHKQFLLFEHYQSNCIHDYDSLVSQPFILFLLHYEPEAVVDHFSNSKSGQISAILEACNLLRGKGFRFLVKEHPSTFTLSFANGEKHVPLFRDVADYQRLLDAGLLFIDNSFNYERFLTSSSLICVSSIASTGLYQAQLSSKYIYPLGTTIYQMTNLSLDSFSFKSLPNSVINQERQSSMDDYLIPNHHLELSLDQRLSSQSFSCWLNYLHRIISSQ